LVFLQAIRLLAFFNFCRGIVETDATGGTFGEVVDDDGIGAPRRAWYTTYLGPAYIGGDKGHPCLIVLMYMFTVLSVA
jgi:hypothetical protein